MFFYSCSRVPTVPELDSVGPQIFSNFPSFSNLFQPFVNFLPLLSFQYAASSKLFPRKQLRRSSKVFTLPLDYTHRVSVVSITTYNCLHCNSCNVPKITKSSLKNSKVANCSKVTRSTGLWTLPPAWGSFARTANFQPRNSGGKSDCLHLFYRHFVFSDLDLIDWWLFVNLK